MAATDDDITGVLARSALFRGVPSSIVSGVSARCDAVILATDERLLTAGFRDETLYLIVSGSLRTLSSGTAADRAPLGPGDCVGGRSLVGGGPNPDDVIARESSVLLAFDHAELWSLVDASPEFARNLLLHLAGRNQAASPARRIRERVTAPTVEASTLDPVTGLPNRRWMEDAFARQIERSTRTAQSTSILVVDVDRFDALSVEHGPHVADAVALRTAQALTKSLRPDDLLSRCGDGMFAVLLPGLEAQATIDLAERLRAAVETASDSGSNALPRVTVSIGGTTRRPFETLAELLKRAEEALRHAQRTRPSA